MKTEMGVDSLVRVMPDKRNDQIESSPMEENNSPTFSPLPTAEVRLSIEVFANCMFL